MDLLQKTKNELPADGGERKIIFNKSTGIFPLILDNIPTPVTYITPDHYYGYVNKAYADWFRVTPPDITGKHVKDFLGAEAYDAIKSFMDKALGGEVVYYEDEIPFKQGKRFINATYSPDFDERGKVKGYVALIRDVTEKKRLEIKSKESRSHYEQLINGLPAAIYTTDKDGYLTMYNQAAVDLWGRQPEIGKD